MSRLTHPAHPDARSPILGVVFDDDTSSSESNVFSETTTEQTDRRIGATDRAIVVSPESNSPVNLTVDSDEALAFARDVAEGAQATVERTIQRALDTADNAAGAAEETNTRFLLTGAALVAGAIVVRSIFK